MDPDVCAHLLVAEDLVKKRSDDPLDRIPEKVRPLVPIWFAFLAPPIAAITHLQLSYVFEHTACSTRSMVQIHAATVILLAIDLIAGWMAHRQWVRLGGEPPGQLPGPVGSRRHMALEGMIGAGIFGLFILAQWFPNFVLGPCVRT